MSGRNRSQQDVELNMASMLDMAFQLLAFFILTFQPLPLESQISLRLPPAKPASNPNGQGELGNQNREVEPRDVNTLAVTLSAKRNGDIDFGESMTGVGGQPVASLADLSARLRGIFKNPDSPYEQVVVQSSPKLRYGELMQVVNVCTQQRFPDGKKLDKLSFAELPEANNHERWNVGQ
jgi:biopolymer transport protein ExbD